MLLESQNGVYDDEQSTEAHNSLPEAKSRLLSVVSHELKGPLSTFRMGVHLLLEQRVGSLSDQQIDLLIMMRDDSDRLQQTVENLLDMGRFDAGKAQINLRPQAASTVISEAVEPMRQAFRERCIDLRVDIRANAPHVLVDRATIHHLFSNLLSNALKYTPAGGRVRISAEPQNHSVRFWVADNGPGIPGQYLSRLFDPFFRVPGQASGSGTGLGLAIARDIVEVHGGHISVQSRPGEGATFRFTLQRAPETPPKSQQTRKQGRDSRG